MADSIQFFRAIWSKLSSSFLVKQFQVGVHESTISCVQANHSELSRERMELMVFFNLLALHLAQELDHVFVELLKS